MTEAAARQKVQALFSYLRAQGDADYIGEAISQLQHSLQAADLAAAAVGPDEEETILAALLHDVGRFIPDSDDRPRMISPDGTYVGTEDHEIVGEKYLRDLGFSDKVCSIVGAHVWAKRYLCATEPGYWEALSKSSKETLKFQVCMIPEIEVQLMRSEAVFRLTSARAAYSRRPKSKKPTRTPTWPRSWPYDAGMIKQRCLTKRSRVWMHMKMRRSDV